MLATAYKSPLHETVSTTKTDYWNDSCSVEELTYAIENGAVGATTNPTIVLGVLKKEMHLWKDRIYQIIAENPTATEDEITWQLIEEMAVKGAELLKPVYEREQGLKGRISIQTNPTFYRNAEAIAQQAVHFCQAGPQHDGQDPGDQRRRGGHRGGDVRGRGDQRHRLLLGAAVAGRGRGHRTRVSNRRAAAGKPVDHMRPVCTIMIGRLDDWIHVLEKRDSVAITPGYGDWAGIAAIKKAYGIYQERGYRTRLLAAAYRHHLHWSELIGGDIVMTIPYEWQRLFNGSDIEVKPRFQDPVPQEIVDTLYAKFPDFRRAYDADGMTTKEFDQFGPTARTLRSFIGSYRDLLAVIRDFMLPNPDVKK